MAFILTGALSVIWLAAWLTIYREPEQHPRVTPQELAWINSEPEIVREKLSFGTLLRMRQTWAYMAGRFLIDPVWWTFLFWLPDFFNRQFGVNMLNFGPPLVVVYLLADVGSISGGWLSSHLLTRNWSLNRARKTGMLIAGLCAVPIAFAADAPNLWWAVGLIGLACAGHQAFSANLYALPGDLLPRSSTGSSIGLGGLAGAAGGMLMARSAGAILQAVGSYRPIFLISASAYLLALLVVHLILPRYQPAEGVTPL
jgi:MFS transporter, ACS family, hexuronate transporter